MKRLIKRDINPADIEVLEILKSEVNNQSIFKWIHSKEFRYRGGMYDLIAGYETIETDNSFIFTVINDVKEEELVASFVSGLKGSPYSGLMKLIKIFVFDSVLNIFNFNLSANENRILFHQNIYDIILRPIDIILPPPKTKPIY
ncbi:MAG: hypothetical protein KIT33_13180 [Candidatus Kapabacteria bacterium]|nr:hypothetical protein [Ignavibacteriota bacterium]MCW5885916.1 hypothetical protein [Candidatus Kapabacteria bacterium]